METFLEKFLSLFFFVALIIGSFVGYYFRKFLASKYFEGIEKKTQEIEMEAKKKSQELILTAKEKALKIIEEAKKDEKNLRLELIRAEKKLEERRALFDKKLAEFIKENERLEEKARKIEKAKEKVIILYDEARKNLEKISGLSKSEAQKILLSNLEKEMKEEILERIKKIDKEGQEEIQKKTRELLVKTMERFASSVVSETTTSLVNISNEEMKGRIIGREGRNVKVFEHLTGVEVIIDDTPATIILSSFSPLRRELAKRVLEKLMVDGRIHPGRIEKVFEETKVELATEIKKIGEEVVSKLGIFDLDPKLIQLLGRLKFRTSYGQNVLQHSFEVANFSAHLAEELGGNVNLAKKAGLFHDIGKAIDHEIEGTHPEIGKELGQKFHLEEEVVTAIATHHEDHPSTLEAVIVKVADALSGSRPGARQDSFEEYLKRLENLEKIALGFPGVEKAYAIQAGREIRVFVRPEEIDDLTAIKMAKEIARKIEEELRYPGEIKVSVIREKRVVEYAR